MKYKNEYILTLMFWCFYVGSTHAVEVKKSTSGICHDQNSPYFIKTKNFTSFNTLESCLSTGGRLPKGSKRKSSNYADKIDAPKNINTKLNYSRSQFGNGWADTDNDCQNSRMETLISQSVGQVQYHSTKQCKVRSGKWISLFTGRTIYSASEIDIDHVVPLYWAWHRGADKWSKKKRVEFANASANLLGVEASLNRQKGANGLDKWLPPANQCQYVSRFLRVSKTYDLKLTSTEKFRYSELKLRYCS